MKNRITIFIIMFLTFFFTSAIFAQDSTKVAQQKVHHGPHFVDKNGDGYNDNAPDHDGDGIPNGLDPDWLKMMNKHRMHRPFRDLNGDGINDFAPRGRHGMRGMAPKAHQNPGRNQEHGHGGQMKGKK